MKLPLLSRWLWREWIRPVGVPVLMILGAKSALADINPVPSGSMKPTVLEGDVVFVNKLAYDLKVPFTTRHLAQWGDPVRGDIVVCFAPDDGTRLLKRVIGVPGDTIELRQDVLILNGTPLAYSNLDAPLTGIAHLERNERAAALFVREALPNHPHPIMVLPRMLARRTFGPITVPAGSYFVMGDNRDNSRDSRFFGFVPRREIVGQAKAVFVSADFHHWLKPRFNRFCTALN
jgi:signal peptidase I